MGAENYVGGDIKILVKLTANGFDQETGNYEIELHCGNNNPKYFKKKDVKLSSDGNYYLFVNTEGWEPGPMYLVVTAYTVDADVPTADHIRKEKAVVNLGPLRPLPVKK